MKQSKRMSLAESLINIVVGFGISLGAQVFFLPLLGVSIALQQNIVFALIMTVISIARSFALRRLFEALHIRVPLTPFMQAVVAECRRQETEEGYDAAHDDAHAPGELAAGGAAYLIAAYDPPAPVAPDCWRWDDHWWNPKDPRRNLVRGCALGMAEGNKFDRARKRKAVPPGALAARWPTGAAP